jgi:gelsolin
MLKQVKLDIAQTNMALFGTDVEKKIKQAAAQTEVAWHGSGQQTGIEIWRINQFKVEKVPKEHYGQFFEGDSYIILRTIKSADGKVSYDVFFWLGTFTTQDEAGTAAYKTVELDDFFKGLPIQHREVQGYESEQFLSLFSNIGGIRILKGGYETGFKHNAPTTYKPRLLHVCGTIKNVRVVEVPLSAASLNSGDVFILDLGLAVHQWNGKQSNVAERNKAAQLVRAIDDERGSKVAVSVHEEGDKDLAEFWQHLGGEKPVAASAASSAPQSTGNKSLWRLSDASGTLTFTKVAEGKLSRSQIDSNDVFIVDSGFEVFSWVGKSASVGERRTALQYALNYLSNQNKNPATPVTRILEGGENEIFEQLFH